MNLTRRNLVFGAAALPVAGAISWAGGAYAATEKVYSERGIAVDGSDVVGYFDKGAPVKGRAEFSHIWRGVTWHFETAQNRDLFAANPTEYAPQYGGFCSYAVSKGYTASTTPEAWKIVNGKLYLNYSRRIQRKWERDIPGNIKAADANWPSLSA